MMAYVWTEHVVVWFKRHPGRHRTDQQGQRIVCPTEQPLGYPASALGTRPSHFTKCPFCNSHLGHAELILDDPGHNKEWQWSTAA